MKISISKSKEIKGNVHSFFTTMNVPFLQLPIVVRSCVWSPITWRGGTRNERNFIEASYLSLDFDDGRWTLDDAKKWLSDQNLAGLVGTSKSHQKEKVSKAGVVQPAVDRFRIIVPFESPIQELRLYRGIMSAVMDDVPCDQSCKDGARFFYPCTDISWQAGDGGPYVIPDVPLEPEKKVYRDKMELAKSTGILPTWLLVALNYGVAPGHRNTMIYKIAANLAVAGYTYSTVVEMIMESPLKDIGGSEVEQAVRNGFAAGSEEA